MSARVTITTWRFAARVGDPSIETAPVDLRAAFRFAEKVGTKFSPKKIVIVNPRQNAYQAAGNQQDSGPVYLAHWQISVEILPFLRIFIIDVIDGYVLLEFYTPDGTLPLRVFDKKSFQHVGRNIAYPVRADPRGH
jgi:hypothetical protein